MAAALRALEESVRLLAEACAGDGGAAGGAAVGAPASWRAAGEDLSLGLHVLRAACGSLSSGATKLALVCAGAAPTMTEAQGICREMADAARQLRPPASDARAVTCRAGCGAPLDELVRAAARRVLVAVAALAVALQDDAQRAAAAPQAGVVWEMAGAASKLPLTNRTAYRRKVLSWAAECKDVIDEFGAQTEEDNDDDDNDDDDDDDADDGGDDPFGDLVGGGAKYAGPAERAAVKRCLHCLEATGAAYRLTLAAMDAYGDAACFAAVAAAYDAAAALAAAAAQLAEELYPPLDRAGLADGLAALQRAAAALLAMDPAADAVDALPLAALALNAAPAAPPPPPSAHAALLAQFEARGAAANAALQQLQGE
ncbi:hypothetical protein M885DRAFT_578923 [Pelagophyceae sp. CCMP2097]|nr:hypothetical protein M885DRAFT_578923 [Pelagophyceae sp. CCMP2097]